MRVLYYNTNAAISGEYRINIHMKMKMKKKNKLFCEMAENVLGYDFIVDAISYVSSYILGNTIVVSAMKHET